MTLRFARVSLGVDLQVYTRNYTVSYKREEVLLRKKRMSRPPSAICPPPLPPASSHPHLNGGGVDKRSSTTSNVPLQKTRNFAGVGKRSSSYFARAVVSPFEARVGACRLLVRREPADGLQRRARPPRWPRPLSSSLFPLLLPLKIQRRSCSP